MIDFIKNIHKLNLNITDGVADIFIKKYCKDCVDHRGLHGCDFSGERMGDWDLGCDEHKEAE